MYTIHTQLWHFKYNSIHNIGPQNVVWYKLNESGDGIPLSEEESLSLTNYFANHNSNFKNQNRHRCNDEDGIYCFSLGKPKNKLINVILRKIPDLPKAGFIPRCVDIALCDETGSLNHNYDLDFDIIGEIV